MPAQAELWFRKTPLDMDWINKFIVMALQVLLKMNRFHTIVQLGPCARTPTLVHSVCVGVCVCVFTRVYVGACVCMCVHACVVCVRAFVCANAVWECCVRTQACATRSRCPPWSALRQGRPSADRHGRQPTIVVLGSETLPQVSACPV